MRLHSCEGVPGLGLKDYARWRSWGRKRKRSIGTRAQVSCWHGAVRMCVCMGMDMALRILEQAEGQHFP